MIDTNVFVSAILGAEGASREVLRLALKRQVKPVFGNALLAEYEDVLQRDAVFEKATVSKADRLTLFEALLSVSQWHKIHFLWRPNLVDEGDNHIVELAVAADAQAVITSNVRDFAKGELAFPELLIITPGDWLKRKAST